MKAFFSYSHYDEPTLIELRKHLSMLRREGAIDEWHDRKLLPGDEFDAHIDEQLESSDLIFLLLSHNFLASEYCMRIEMNRALEKHQEGSARVVPIILEPCDWRTESLSALTALPLDAKPISEWVNPNSAYLNIVQEIRRLIDQNFAEMSQPELTCINDFNRLASEKYRPKREFGAVEISKFRTKSFKIISSYFSSAVSEINTIDGVSAAFETMDSSAFSCCIENHQHRFGPAFLTVRIGGGRHSFGDIYYSASERANSGVANGMYTIEASEFDLFFRSSFSMTHARDLQLSPEHIAEQMWNGLVERAGIEYA